MLSILLTIGRLIKAIRQAWKDTEFRNVLILLVTLVLSGTVFYAIFEGWSPVDALYFSVVTLATVGYGDLAPKTVAGKLFTVAYLFIGIGLFVAVARDLADGLATARRERLERKKGSRSQEGRSTKSDPGENKDEK